MTKNSIIFFLLLPMMGFSAAGSTDTIAPIVIDTAHYSNIFSQIKQYRVYLPPDYYTSNKHYPVIYFLHGWSQRAFGAIGVGYANFDKGSDNNGDNIANYVSKHKVIIVKMDGYDRFANENYYVRPYNIGPVEKSFRQFPQYFPELMQEIDANFKTIPNRGHRGICGLSMGGFMAYWIAGMYPQAFCTAGSFCGSTEFEAGPFDLPVEYKHAQLNKNYNGIRVRLHYGDQDFLRSYQEDLQKSWLATMPDFSQKMYPAVHSTCGLADMFDFMQQSFKSPLPVPVQWNHINLYPSFKVWNYQVVSDRNQPGFTILENVRATGFKIAVREHLPAGRLLHTVQLRILTAGIYKKNTAYLVNDINLSNHTATKTTVYANGLGQLLISCSGSEHQIGIAALGANADLFISSFALADQAWITPGKTTILRVGFSNKGFASATGVSAVLTSNYPGSQIEKNKIKFASLSFNQQNAFGNFQFTVLGNSVEKISFRLQITDSKGNQWEEQIELPVKQNTNQAPEYIIADGKWVTTARAGIDTEKLFLGNGNGDGFANAGESIVVLIKDGGLYRRAFLYFKDEFVNRNGEDNRMSENWGDFDHGGASAKYSIPVIAGNCTDGHSISFFAEYIVPSERPSHQTRGGTISITVSGNDKTPPNAGWASNGVDNSFMVQMVDGSEIKSVTAYFTPDFTMLDEYLGEALKARIRAFSLPLFDDGAGPDKTKGDRVFSCKVLSPYFSQYSVEIQAEDIYGNISKQKLSGVFTAHD
jgi:S-formylglutathione hydrolase FrmB